MWDRGKCRVKLLWTVQAMNHHGLFDHIKIMLKALFTETALLITNPLLHFSWYFHFRFITSLLLWIGVMKFFSSILFPPRSYSILESVNNRDVLPSDSRYAASKAVVLSQTVTKGKFGLQYKRNGGNWYWTEDRLLMSWSSSLLRRNILVYIRFKRTGKYKQNN